MHEGFKRSMEKLLPSMKKGENLKIMVSHEKTAKKNKSAQDPVSHESA
jgi:hypothetical protein